MSALIVISTFQNVCVCVYVNQESQFAFVLGTNAF